ncbi:MAG: ABC transporter ATP-binding protein [Actinomycetes bacterium]
MIPILQVKDLKVHFQTDDGLVKAVDGISFDIAPAKTLGIVGESGSGKSVTSLAIMGLHKGSRAEVSGEILIDGLNINSASEEEVAKIRGKSMSMIFQDSLAALHPFFKVGDQIAEAYRVHNKVSEKQAKKVAVEMLGRVGIPNPAQRIEDFPHQFSGGMRQRVMIAMALSCNPKLLIADEPTTALDVTVQAQILDLLRDLQREFGSSILMITHDLGVVAEIADDVLLMYAGKAIEKGTVRELLKTPQHPYAWGLLTSIPKLNSANDNALLAIPGTPPSLINLPNGCSFSPRCSFKDRSKIDCTKISPELLSVSTSNGHLVSCHLPDADRVILFNNEIAAKL